MNNGDAKHGTDAQGRGDSSYVLNKSSCISRHLLSLLAMNSGSVSDTDPPRSDYSMLSGSNK